MVSSERSPGLDPALLHLDRPGFTGMVAELDDIERIARAATRQRHGRAR